MSQWIKTLDDALAEARDADDPCCMQCTRTALTMLADEVDSLRGIKERIRTAIDGADCQAEFGTADLRYFLGEG